MPNPAPSKPPLVIAHRGLRNEFPENTVIAIREALALPGIHGIEFDVELSDLPVVLHQETVVADPEFCRLVPAERNHTSRDWVAAHAAAEITRLDAGSWFDPRFASERVPLLKQILALDWRDVTAYIELKDPTFWGQRDPARPKKMVELVLPVLTAFKGTKNIISFNPEMIAEARRAGAATDCTLALWTEWRGKIDQALDCARRAGAGCVSLPEALVLEDKAWVTSAHAAGLQIHVYPVTPARGEPEYGKWSAESQKANWIALIQAGVDALISDFPRETLALPR